jgi:hypothetical protein
MSLQYFFCVCPRLNHALRLHADLVDNFPPIPDAETLPLYRMVLRLACVCCSVEVTFPYQEPTFHKGVQVSIKANRFWKQAASLPPTRKGWHMVQCNCAGTPGRCPNGYRYRNFLHFHRIFLQKYRIFLQTVFHTVFFSRNPVDCSRLFCGLYASTVPENYDYRRSKA